ncbi:hypothetical protein JOQ06_024213, partial [Pogonophryne albipinna]
HRGNKSLNWDLTPSRDILIIGASNIARLPRVRVARIQVDSFPGANLSQAATLIRRKMPTSPMVQQVVLAFGLNDREQGNPTLLESNFLKLWRAAKDTFPNATIHVPIINISAEAPPRHKENIRGLNHIIFRTGQSIPKLRRSAFATVEDKVHWSPATAQAMLAVGGPDLPSLEDRAVVNLSSTFRPSHSVLELLRKGFSFVPVPKTFRLERGGLQEDLATYHRRLRLVAFFGQEQRDVGPRFQEPSIWEPGDTE